MKEGSFGDTLLDHLDLTFKEGPLVLPKVANLVQNICKLRLSDSKLKEKFQKYDRSGNMDLLQTTKLHTFQLLNIKAMTAITSLVNDILVATTCFDKESLLPKLIDVLG